MAITGDAALSTTKQQTISTIAQRLLISESVLGGTIMDMSAMARKGDLSVSFPKYGSFTVENRGSAVAGTTQNLTFEVDTMLLDQRAHIQWLVDTNDEEESVLNVREIYIRAAAQEHAVDVDRKIKAQLELAGVATATGGDITKDIVLEMREALIRRKARRNELTLAVSPEQEANLLAVPEFIRPDAYFAGSTVIPNGVLGRVYGVNVVVTPELDADEYYMYGREACAIAFQRAPQFDFRKAPEYGPGGQLEILAQKYGVKAMHIEQQGVGAGESALIVKDANA